ESGCVTLARCARPGGQTWYGSASATAGSVTRSKWSLGQRSPAGGSASATSPIAREKADQKARGRSAAPLQPPRTWAWSCGRDRQPTGRRAPSAGRNDVVTGLAAQILVIAKAPVPGRVKTRLTPPFSPRQAARLAEAALADTLAVASRVPAARHVIALDGEPRHWLPCRFRV